MEKTTKAVAAATKKETANANTNSAAKTATPNTAAAKPETKPAAAPGILEKVAIVDPIKGTPAEAKPAAPAKEALKAAEPTPEAAPAAAAPSPTAAALAAKEQELKEKNAAKLAALGEEMKKKQSFAELQKRLNEELQRLNHKKEIADKRDVFLQCGGKIDEYLKQLREETEFETNLCRLSFEIFEKDNYGRESFKDFMTVSNTAIVQKFCNVLKDEIAAKVAELENELLQD